MNTKTTILIGTVLTALLVGGLTSCNREALPERTDGQALLISPALLHLEEAGPVTRAIAEADLKGDQYKENVINTLDIFLFESDGTLKKDYHIAMASAELVTRDGKEGYLVAKDWTRELQSNHAYSVYVVANADSDSPIRTAGGIANLADLKAESVQDDDIYKRYHETLENTTYTRNKAFLMDWHATWTTGDSGVQLIDDDSATGDSQEKVILERAAVKIIAEIRFSESFKANLASRDMMYDVPSWKYINFNTVAAVVSDGTVPTADLQVGGSGKYLTVENKAAEGEDPNYRIVTYAYPHNWTAETAVENAPAIFLSFPAYKLNSDGTKGDFVSYHYYYIPLCASSVTSLARNHAYQVNGTISSFGSTEEISNSDMVLNYSVKDWTVQSSTLDVTAIEYLVVTPTKSELRGGGNTALTTQIKYYASGTVTIDNKKCQYINKNGTSTDVNANNWSVGNPSDGVITVTSKVPANGTYQDITFTVKCGSKSQDVIIRHYPLDFVVNTIKGQWSSYVDNKWAYFGISGRSYNVRTTSGSNNSYQYASNDYFFSAKYFYEGMCYILETDGTRGTPSGYWDWHTYSWSTLTNQHMYALQITSVSDEYVMGIPNVGSNSQSNDDVLSPAFLLASQLGAVLPTEYASIAATHCTSYMEVDVKGKEWKGWRLPTKSELRYMATHQSQYNQVMDDVLTGKYYWSLDAGYVEVPGGSQGTTTNRYVRCVRDLTPKEVEEINAF